MKELARENSVKKDRIMVKIDELDVANMLEKWQEDLFVLIFAFEDGIILLAKDNQIIEM